MFRALWQPQLQDAALHLLHIFTANNPSLLAAVVRSGAIVFALQMFATEGGGSDPRRRERAGSFLQFVMSDPHSQSQAKAVLRQLLPAPIVTEIATAGARAVQFFDSFHETPELFWNGTTREELRALLADEGAAISRGASAGSDYQPRGPFTNFSALREELQVAGVYIRIYNATTGWVLLHPDKFALELLQRLLLGADQASTLRCYQRCRHLTAYPDFIDRVANAITSGHLFAVVDRTHRRRH